MNQARPITRQDQRKLTRRRIVDAARDCFYEHGVAEVSIEQIARVAQVGRATLYLHFPNKDAILLELLALDLLGARKIFARLCALEHVDAAAARDWLMEYVETLRQHSEAMRLVHVGIATSEEARAKIHEHHSAVAAMMSERFPAATDGTPRGHVRLMLMIARIDHLASAAAETPPRLDPEAGIELVASELVDLVSD